MPAMVTALYALLVAGVVTLGYGGSPLTAFFGVVLIIFLFFARERMTLLIQIFLIVGFMCAAGDLIANSIAQSHLLETKYYVGIAVGAIGHIFGLVALTRPSVKTWLAEREAAATD